MASQQCSPQPNRLPYPSGLAAMPPHSTAAPWQPTPCSHSMQPPHLLFAHAVGIHSDNVWVREAAPKQRLHHGRLQHGRQGGHMGRARLGTAAALGRCWPADAVSTCSLASSLPLHSSSHCACTASVVFLVWLCIVDFMALTQQTCTAACSPQGWVHPIHPPCRTRHRSPLTCR